MKTIPAALAALALTLTGCSASHSEPTTATPQPAPQPATAKCKTAAYRALPQVLAGDLTETQGQAIVDEGCNGLDKDTRAKILSDAKLDILASWGQENGQ